MRFLMMIVCMGLLVPVSAQTYRTGSSSRPSFGGTAADSSTEESSVPGARSNIQTRTFSNYSSRKNWSKGVQTQTVQTNTAGSQQQSFEEITAPGTAAAVQAAMSGKNQVQAQQSATGKSAATTSAQTNAKTAPSTAQPAAQGQPAAAADPTAMLQQMQGMLQGLGAMGGNPAGGAKGGSSTGGVGSIPGMPAGVNVPGMPDMSALLNAASAGQQPAASK